MTELTNETSHDSDHISNPMGIPLNEFLNWLSHNVMHDDSVLVGVLPDEYGSYRPVHLVQYINGELRIHLRKNA